MLVCQKAQKEFYLSYHKVYINNSKKMSITESKNESPIDATFLQVALDICIASMFYQALINPPKTQLVFGSGLSNDLHNCQHVHKIITPNKELGIFLGFYYLNTLFLYLFDTRRVDKVARCYSHQLLAWAKNVYEMQIKHKIARLDIITVQADNKLFAFKAKLGHL